MGKHGKVSPENSEGQRWALQPGLMSRGLGKYYREMATDLRLEWVGLWRIWKRGFVITLEKKNRVIIDLGTKEGRRRRQLGVLLLIKSLKGKAKGGWEENFREF